MATTTTPHRKAASSRRSQTKFPLGPAGPWSSAAPAGVIAAYESPDSGPGWEAWRKHLRARRQRRLAQLLRCDDPPLAWSVPHGEPFDSARALIKQLARLEQGNRRAASGASTAATEWLARAESAPLTAALALESVAWCWALPHLAEHCDEKLWWRLLNHLVAAVEEPVDSSDKPLTKQLACGELALTLAYTFPELARCAGLRSDGRRASVNGLKALLNGSRYPHCRTLPDVRPLLASWTRCRALGSQLEGAWGGVQADRQYQTLLNAALRLSRRGRQAVFAPDDASKWDDSLLAAATRMAGRDSARLARLTTDGRTTNRANDSLPKPAFDCESAGLAQLRSNWSPDSPLLTVAYGAPQVRLELSVDTRTLLSGGWEVEIDFAGRRLEPLGDWQQTCWLSDHDMDYLELCLDLTHGVELERHILLARAHRILFLADTVLGTAPGRIDYASCLPLADDAQFRPEDETREGTLFVGRKPMARAMPLALPEWRVARGRGEFQAEDRVLRLTQSSEQPRLLAPLFLDLDTSRFRRDLTWRQLTVAEDRENVPVDVAAGFRVQLDASQWVIYRSLAPPAIRSLLSKSLMHQFMFGMFSDEGKVEPQLEIDPT